MALVDNGYKYPGVRCLVGNDWQWLLMDKKYFVDRCLAPEWRMVAALASAMINCLPLEAIGRLSR